MQHLGKDVLVENIQIEVLKHPKKSALIHVHYLNCVRNSWNGTRISLGAWQYEMLGRIRETVLKLHLTKLRKGHQSATPQGRGWGGTEECYQNRAEPS